jgi:hypothetical protein
MRRRNVTTFAILGLAGALVAAAAARGHRGSAPAPTPPPIADHAGSKVQVAQLLDTSNSMDGLIDQARSQLWRIVNELAASKRDGRAARVELALFEYGKDTVPAADGYVRQVVPFTTDLDRVSEALFGLTTNGGEEYCGRAIAEATRQLEWSASPDDLKLVFIAGNEPFDQGQTDWHDAIKSAKARGIVVNVIHAGAEDERGWREAAAFAGGEYVAIDHNQKVAAIRAPQDEEIERLGVDMNKTYLPYGVEGQAAAARQSAQDDNAKSVRQGATVQRSLSKASAAYDNAGWDLVDAVHGGMDVEKADAKDLPEKLRALAPGERRAAVEAMAKERAEIQVRIRQLDGDRRAWIAAQAKDGAGTSTLDTAVVRAVRAQAEKRGFQFE